MFFSRSSRAHLDYTPLYRWIANNIRLKSGYFLQNPGLILTNFVENEEEAKLTGIEPVFRKPGCIGERVRRAVLRAVKFIREDLRRATGFGRTSRFGGKQRVSRKCGN